MARLRVPIEELLLRHRAIDDEQLRYARDQQRKVGGDLGRVLIELGFVSEELVLRAQAHQLGIPMVDPEKSPPPRELAAALGETLCRRFGVIPVSGNLESKLLRVATSTPTNTVRLTQLQEAAPAFRIEIAGATSDKIEKAIRAAFSGGGGDPLEEHPEIHPEPDPHDELAERVAKLEKMLANPQFAALSARVERLEQIIERDHHALNVIGQAIIEAGVITREELKKRLGRG